MMNRAMVLTAMLVACMQALFADGFSFTHGPYLQNVGSSEAEVFFTTSSNAFSWVEVIGEEWKTPKRFYGADAGLLNAYCNSNAVRIEGLKPGKRYSYRMISKEMVEFRPYRITYGDSIASSWMSFSTLPEKMTNCSFVVVNDGHDDADKVRALLNLSSLSAADAVVFLGDMVSHFENANTLYDGFIDVSTELFAKEKPFIAVRGNHETRGNLARTLSRYVGRVNEKFYGTYYYGNTVLIVIDCGEDKPDGHPVYGGINKFDEYRIEQAHWLEREIKTSRFRKTKNRIVLMHIPPVQTSRTAAPEEYATGHLAELFIPVFNKANVDLVLSGHTHRHYFIEEGERGVNKFPVLINDNRSVVDLIINKDDIKVKITTLDGDVLFSKQF